MKKIMICICALSLATACKNWEEKKARYAEISNASWLVGTWENATEGGLLSETWEKVDDSTYSGKSYFIKGKDTLHSESIELAERKGVVIYSPTVKGQNDDLPVAFRLTSRTGKQMVFENPSHDFPQKITYRQVTADSLVASISGVQQGKPASEQYPMKKKQD